MCNARLQLTAGMMQMILLEVVCEVHRVPTSVVRDLVLSLKLSIKHTPCMLS